VVDRPGAALVDRRQVAGPVGRRNSGGYRQGRSEGRSIFFEKKKQKTFVRLNRSAPSMDGALDL